MYNNGFSFPDSGTMNIGRYQIDTPVALAPMAGITDKPFRMLAKEHGAGWTVGEMLTSDPSLRHTAKTLWRSDRSGEHGVLAVQIVGSDPKRMAEAAQYNVANGAEVIDINMGCPAKKVCNVAAGSALLQNEPLVSDILHAVVEAVDVPVTLKTRLGWDDEHQNLPIIAEIAQNAGIAALAVHGRTRTQMYSGEASYRLIGEVCRHMRIPVWVNGDIDSPQKAARVLHETGADGVMIGRAAQGQPWLFADIRHYLQYGECPSAPTFQTAAQTVLQHLSNIYDFYGEAHGVRIARKHIAWYTARLPENTSFRQTVNRIDDAQTQHRMVAQFFDRLNLNIWPTDYRRKTDSDSIPAAA